MSILVALMLAAAPANANQVILTQLQSYDERVGRIGYALAHGGVELCPAKLAPLAGLRIHTLGQYGKAVRADARVVFGLSDYPAILTLSGGGAAAQAGLKKGDWILSINGIAQISGAGYEGVARFDATLTKALSSPPVILEVERGGTRTTVSLTGLPGCASQVELVTSSKLNAAADGTIVQITTGVLEQAHDDNELAFIIAHEMAHNILKHSERLDRIGRSTANIRTTETEADLLSLKLMKSAGYDPSAAARFWQRFGKKTGAGIFSDGTHMRTKSRVRFLQEEATKIAQ
jgi:beta-barrel assembly-enhancing protease